MWFNHSSLLTCLLLLSSLPWRARRGICIIPTSSSLGWANPASQIPSDHRYCGHPFLLPGFVLGEPSVKLSSTSTSNGFSGFTSTKGYQLSFIRSANTSWALWGYLWLLPEASKSIFKPMASKTRLGKALSRSKLDPSMPESQKPSLSEQWKTSYSTECLMLQSSRD